MQDDDGRWDKDAPERGEGEMKRQCPNDRCQAMIPFEAQACGMCGTRFDAPSDTDQSDE